MSRALLLLDQSHERVKGAAVLRAPTHDDVCHREEKVIAVFGHGDFFHYFLGRHMGSSGVWMGNCEVITGSLL